MKRPILFGVKLSEDERRMVDLIAAKEERSPSDAVRRALRERARALGIAEAPEEVVQRGPKGLRVYDESGEAVFASSLSELASMFGKSKNAVYTYITPHKDGYKLYRRPEA